MKVAFLGLGIMGRAMAGNLVKGGPEVTVWNRGAGAPVEGTQLAGNPEDVRAERKLSGSASPIRLPSSMWYLACVA